MHTIQTTAIRMYITLAIQQCLNSNNDASSIFSMENRIRLPTVDISLLTELTHTNFMKCRLIRNFYSH